MITALLFQVAFAGTVEDCVAETPASCEALAAAYDAAPGMFAEACEKGGKNACELAARAHAGLVPWTDPAGAVLAWQQACAAGDTSSCAQLDALPTFTVDGAAILRWAKGGDGLPGLAAELAQHEARPVRLDVAPTLPYARLGEVLSVASTGVDAVLMRTDPDADYLLVRTEPTPRPYDQTVGRTFEVEIEGRVSREELGEEWYAPLLEREPAMTACYTRALATEPTADGTVIVELRVAQGRVLAVLLSRNDIGDVAGFDTCIVGLLKEAEFPYRDDIVMMKHPLQFAPD